MTNTGFPRRTISFLMTKRGLIAAGIVIVVIAAVGFRTCRAGNSKTVKPKIGPLVDAVYALGTVKAERTYSLRLGVSASLVDIRVSEGQEVRKGDRLIVTDSGIAFDAPFSGIVYKLNYEKGENAMPGTPVLTLIDPSFTYILVSLDQQSAIKVRRGQKAELSFEGIRSDKYTGTVERIYPSVGQFYARIRADAMPAGVLPDMNVDVAIEVSRKDRALMVPASAIRDGNITLLRKGKRISLKCRTGAVNEGWTEVTDNSVAPDDEILLPE